MSVTVASGERSFSKLRLIKTYPWSTISQERLNNLVMQSIENDITKSIDFEMILKDFSDKKSQKSLFLEGLCTNSMSVIILTCNKTLKLSYGLSIFSISLWLMVEPQALNAFWLGLAYYTKHKTLIFSFCRVEGPTNNFLIGPHTS